MSDQKPRKRIKSKFVDDGAESGTDESEIEVEEGVDEEFISEEEQYAAARVDARNKNLRAEQQVSAEEIAQRIVDKAKKERKIAEQIRNYTCITI